MKNGWIKLGGVLGIVYCLAGFVLVFLGWNGAASNDRVEAQMPYLISGGIAGLGLIVVGAGLMVANSLRNDRVELRAAIDDLRDAVAASGAARGGVAATATPTGASGAGLVVAGADSYHRPECALVQGQADVLTMTVAEARDGGRTPCRVCVPDELA
jgi:hypothetical protein